MLVQLYTSLFTINSSKPIDYTLNEDLMYHLQLEALLQVVHASDFFPHALHMYAFH